LGFTLDEVRGLLRLADQPHTPCAEVKQVVVSRLADVKAKIADLRAMQVALSALITKCDAGDQSGCPLVESLLGHAN
jgi:MerR family transcriptional regulator, mercuric resistance operon regulatory protein